MELSPLYLKRFEEATQRGIEQGFQQIKRQTVESILQVKIGEIDEELAKIIDPFIQLESLEIARLSRHLDRSQLLARFDASKNQPES